MTYDEALRYLESLIDFEKLGATYFGRDRFQLATVRELLKRLEHPEEAFKIVHIAGTKGKGSTAAMLDSILRTAGVRTGLFTQPHLVDIRERTLVEGRMVTQRELAQAVSRLRPNVEELNARRDVEPVTFYEAHLAAALLMFAARSVEIAIIETGLGGRLDATNALQPVVCAITRIDYDHTDILGHSIEGIAREKAGILKCGVPCVFAPQAPEVVAVLEAEAKRVAAPVVSLPDADRFRNIKLSLVGNHQIENARVAVALAEILAQQGVKLEPEHIVKGLENVHWPGRFQVLWGQPTLVLDVAHNAVSAQVLREGLERLLQEREPSARLHLIVGMARDKDMKAFIHTLGPLAVSLTATRAQSPRAASPEAMAALAQGIVDDVRCISTVAKAVRTVQSTAALNDVVCVTGSFHVVGEAMQALGIEPSG
ncbi:MAG: bifunctional folylpolyglutamate synthase/dihydrofolate synthase [Candidatus Zipacnadales bacterium]